MVANKLKAEKKPPAKPTTRQMRPLWTPYRVTWRFLTRLCGQTPADPEIVAKWLAVRTPTRKPLDARPIEEINAEVLASLEEPEAEQTFSSLVFQRQDGNLVFRAGTVRAHIKDCGRIISAQFVGKIDGERSFSHRVLNAVYPDEHQYWIPILRLNGSPVRQPDGSYDKPIHVKDKNGKPMDALKRFEYVEPPSMMVFTLKVLTGSVPLSDLHLLFQYGGTHGYGGERGDGEGRYEYDIKAINAA